LTLAVAFGAVSTGCFGSFRLTRSLYDVNRSVEDKYLRSVVTWLFILPYGFTATLDFLIFNVVEFWSGSSPVTTSAPVTKVYAEGDGKAVLTLSREGKTTFATIERYDGGILASTLRVRDDGNGKVTSVETVAGRKVRETTAVADADGSVEVTVTTSSGAGTERYAAAAVQAELARVARIACETRYVVSGAAGMLPPPAARVPAYGG